MSNSHGEPKGGDFVAYIREIEKKQLAAMRLNQAPLTPSQATATSAAASKERALSADEARKLVDRLRTHGASFSPFDLMRLVVGFILLIVGLFDDGGLIALAIAVALLWGPVRRIARLMRQSHETASQPPKQVTDAVFGRGGPDGAKQRPPSRKT